MGKIASKHLRALRKRWGLASDADVITQALYQSYEAKPMRLKVLDDLQKLGKKLGKPPGDVSLDEMVAAHLKRHGRHVAR